MTLKIEQAMKAAIALVLVVLTALSQVVIPHPYDNWVSLGLLVLTPVSVYLAKNVPDEKADSTPPAKPVAVVQPSVVPTPTPEPNDSSPPPENTAPVA